MNLLELENLRTDLCDEMPEFWHPSINALCDLAKSALSAQAVDGAVGEVLDWEGPIASSGHGYLRVKILAQPNKSILYPWAGTKLYLRPLAQGGVAENYLRGCIEATLFECHGRFEELPEWFREIWHRRIGYGLEHASTEPANALNALMGVLCDPEGRVSIAGSDADKEIVADSLRKLGAAISAAPVSPPEKERPSSYIYWCDHCKREVPWRDGTDELLILNVGKYTHATCESQCQLIKRPPSPPGPDAGREKVDFSLPREWIAKQEAAEDGHSVTAGARDLPTPSCFICGHVKPREQWARTHLVYPDIYACTDCVTTGKGR